MDALKIKKIAGDDPKYVIVLSEEFRASLSTSQAKESVVIYVTDARDKRISEILFRYHPFVMDFLPKDLQIETFYRKVRKDEIEKIKSKNESSLPRLKQELNDIGVKADFGEQTINSVEDIGFKILRSELGLGEYPPHWKPAINRWQTGKDLREIAKENILQRILFDPTYTGYLNMAMDKEDADSSVLRDIKDFMEKLL